MSVSVVIPALNEALSIGETVEKVIATLNAAGEESYEVIVVDDGSSDETGAIAAAAGAKVERHLHNMGYGRSLKDGIRAAENETIVITDADGTYPIKDIPVLLEKFREGYDMVVGQRTGSEYQESIFKAPLRELLRKLVEFTSSRKIPDINSGLRVFRKSQALKFEDRLCDTFSYTTSITLALMMNGMFVAYLPIDYYARVGETKVRLFSDSLRTLQYVSEAAVYYNPLRIFGAMSFSLVVFGIALFLVNIIFNSLAFFLISVGCILLAIVVFALGLLGVILKKILDGQNNALSN